MYIYVYMYVYVYVYTHLLSHLSHARCRSCLADKSRANLLEREKERDCNLFVFFTTKYYKITFFCIY